MATNPGRDLRHFPEWLHHEFINWSRWCWRGPWPHPLPPVCCGSAERDYTRFRVENSSEDARQIPPNASSASVVDAVWRNLPDVPKRVLRAEYPQYHGSGRAEFGRVGAARRMHMRLHDYEAALYVAADRVWNAFEARR